MITKLSLVENTYLSPVLMAAARQESYLLLHRPTPWAWIACKVAGAGLLAIVCIRWICR